MEHIVQFGIGIDDDRIVKEIERAATNTIINELKNDVKKVIFDTDYSLYGNNRISTRPSEWTKAQFNNFLNDHKDEIIKMAAENLADKMSRMKAVKEAAVDAVK